MAYFTYTNGLRDHIKKLFDKFAPKELPNKPYFYTFSEYCLKVLSVSESQVINFKKFEKKWRYLLKSIQFDPIDIWAEIRGIIKGYMGINGFRKEEFDKDLIEQKTFDILYKNKLIEGLSNKDSGRFYRCLCLNEMADDRIILEHFPEKEIADAVRILRDLLRTFTYSSDRILKRSKYIDIIEGYSIFNKSERTEIYNFVDKHYKNWLKEENYDENDLALKVIEKTQKNELEKFDALICDEIQDLSELQIFMLRNLTKDKMSVFFAGDVHQTINPTYFDPGRLSNLFYNHNKKKSELTRQFLAKNYRSQEKIVDLASTLAEFRQRTIGKYGDEDDYREVAIRKGTIPKILSFNNDNYKRLFEAAEQRAYVTVVVADEDDKINLKKEFNKANIFTIQEMKGLESQYIVVYNMISKNISAWADIIKNNPEVKRNTKYRYYFNLFYVAITRAIEHLCFLEKDKESEVFFNYADFKKHFETVNIFDSEKLCLTEQSNRKDWKDQGKYYEKKELYKDAIRCYRNAYDEQGEKRCKAKELASEGNYLQAGEILVEIKEFKLALDYFNKSRNYFRQLEVILHYDYLKDYKEIDEYFNGKTNKDVLNIFLESDGKCWNIFNKVYLQPKLGKYKRLVENVVIQLSKL